MTSSLYRASACGLAARITWTFSLNLRIIKLTLRKVKQLGYVGFFFVRKEPFRRVTKLLFPLFGQVNQPNVRSAWMFSAWATWLCYSFLSTSFPFLFTEISSSRAVILSSFQLDFSGAVSIPDSSLAVKKSAVILILWDRPLLFSQIFSNVYSENLTYNLLSGN